MVTGPMPEQAERHEAEGEHRLVVHERRRPCRRDQVGDEQQRRERQRLPEHGEIAGHHAREDGERGAALARGGDDLARRGASCSLVNTLVNSGISAAASVPHEMIVESFHHRPPPSAAEHPGRHHVGDDDREERGDPHQAGERRLEVDLVLALVLRARDRAVHADSATIEVTIMSTRMTKIHTRKCGLDGPAARRAR